MIIADKLRTSNRAEYILYMWQVEDILRAYACDAERIEKEYLSRFNLQEEQFNATREWYANLCTMMFGEGIREKGHLQIVKNALAELEELHDRLANSSDFPYYRGFYLKVLPHIVALRNKGACTESSELQICFDALYGILLLRLRKAEVSPETEQAREDISRMLGQLSDYYFKEKEKEQI